VATIDNDKPRVRPFGALNMFENKIYVLTGHNKEVCRQLLNNPNVEICGFNGKEWIRVECKLIEDIRIDAKEAFLDTNPDLRGRYSEYDENTAVFYMKDATATISSFTSSPKTIHF
jgi:uncharacterized pyridoxamine 5'-phosphate oxidase family protein